MISRFGGVSGQTNKQTHTNTDSLTSFALEEGWNKCLSKEDCMKFKVDINLEIMRVDVYFWNEDILLY